MTALPNPPEVFARRAAEIAALSSGQRPTSREAALAAGRLALPVNPKAKPTAKPVPAILKAPAKAATPEVKPTASKPQYRRTDLAFKTMLGDPTLEQFL